MDVSRVLSRFKYQRLGDRNEIPRKNKQKKKVLRFHGSSQQNPHRSEQQSFPKRSSWRIRLVKKLKVRLATPRSWLIKLREAYINMMLSFSTKRSNAGMIMGPQLSSLAGRNDAISTKDLQRLYAAYIQRAVSEGRLMLVDPRESR